VALQEAVSNRPITPVEQYKAVVSPSKQEIAKLADVLNLVEKVTILGGAGCAGAHSQLIQIASLLQASIDVPAIMSIFILLFASPLKTPQPKAPKEPPP
jgi:thiamine pyrophosphate-dependent acetolactate synthase large subunit-like protein